MSRRSRRITAAAVPLGIIASGLLVWQSSFAAFSATTTNPNNSFSAGTVTLTDDHQPSTVMFNASGLKPGSTGSSCIKVTYNGSLAANVKLYVKSGDLTNTTGDLSPYLTLQVAEGTGSASDCSDFAGGSNLYNPTGSGDTTKTLSDFATTKTTFATGVSAFAPTGAAQTKTYKLTYWLQDQTLAQGKNNSVKFTWEAQNT
jgi:predicted ribosomally synthesized peptide with SipW-like signal peptide